MKTNMIARLTPRQNFFQPVLPDEPFQQYWHHPNCSSINDAELAQTIIGVYAGSKRPLKINFVFSLPIDLFGTRYDTSRYYYRHLDAATNQLFQETVRFVLNVTQEINNGIFSFHEVSRNFKANFSPFFRGIFYAQTASLHDFIEEGKGAFAVRKFDNNGYLKQSIVSLPADFDLINGTNGIYGMFWIYYALTHETYHALGADHLHEFPDILTKLRETPDGVFCSVLPYSFLVNTNISGCQQYCNPGSAVFPGPLDIRSMQLAYQLGEYNYDYEKNYDYVENGIFYLVFFLIISAIYGGAEGFLSKLALVPKKYLIPRKLIEAMLSIGLLAFFIEMDAPDYLSISFALLTALKYIPDKILQKTRFFQDGSRSQRMLESHYHLYILAICSSIFEGVLPLPFYFTLVMSLIGVFLGGVIAQVSGIILAVTLSYLLQLCIRYCCLERRSNVNALEIIPEQIETIELADFGVQSDADDLKLSDLEEEPDDLQLNDLPAVSYEYVQPAFPQSSFEEKNISDIQLAANPHGFYSRLGARLSDFVAGRGYIELKEEEAEEVLEFDASEASLAM